jgi:hypothetical protein
VGGLCNPDGYYLKLKGAEVVGAYDPGKNTFTVTKITPLKVHWENGNSHSGGEETAES